MKSTALVLSLCLGLGLGRVCLGADFNGDGRDDIAVFRASSGLWSIRGLTRVYFGGAGDIPAPGDYNHNGRDDIAVFRPASGLWAVRGITRAYFGIPSDVCLGGSSGRWLPTSGGGIYYNAGNVGIGTANPIADLDVYDTGDAGTTTTLRLHGSGANSNSVVEFWEDAAIAMSMLYHGQVNRLYFLDSTTGSIRFTFTRSGNLGIGTLEPAASLHVLGSTARPGLIVRGGSASSPLSYDLATFLNGDGVEQFWFNGAGRAGARTAWDAFSPYISMHFIPEGAKKSDYEVGDLVAAVEKLAVKTSVAYDPAAVGVICPPEGFISIPTELKTAIAEEGKTVEDFALVPVAYTGDVRVKVNSEGGPIGSGDLIVPSSVPGVGMKGTPESFGQYASAIGKARESFALEQGLIWVSVGVK